MEIKNEYDSSLIEERMKQLVSEIDNKIKESLLGEVFNETTYVGVNYPFSDSEIRYLNSFGLYRSAYLFIDRDIYIPYIGGDSSSDGNEKLIIKRVFANNV